MGQANHLGAYVYPAVAGCRGEVVLEQAQCESAGPATELEDRLRGGELPVPHEQSSGAVLVEGLRVLQGADSIVRLSGFLVGERAQNSTRD